jgi:hypothetical protein
MSGYQVGLEGPLLDFAMRKYSGHRCISSAQLDEIRSQFEVKQSKLANKKRRI